MTKRLAQPDAAPLGQREAGPLVLRLEPVVRLTRDECFQFCRDNPDWRIERNTKGEAELMAPPGWESGAQGAESVRQLANWAKEDRQGIVADAQTGLDLPDGSSCAPDAAWFLTSRLAALPREQRQKFLPLCPDFAIEILSPTDSLTATQDKMSEYLANGLRLGILTDSKRRQAFVYRPGVEPHQLADPETIDCSPELPGFVLDVREVFDVDA